MNKLEQFTLTPDNELQEANTGTENIRTEKSATNNSNGPTIDMFNSAGNTKLEDETDTGEKIKEEDTGSEAPKGRVVLGKLISGKSAVAIINIFIPSFIVFSLTRLGYVSQKSSFKLTQEEKEIMAPVVQDCLDYIVINFDNPFYTLAFVCSMIYGSKILDVVPDLKKLKDDVTKEADNETVSNNEDNGNATKEEVKKVKREYVDLRAKIDSTSIRKDKTRLVIEAIEQGGAKDLIEAWKIYEGIFPERNENYFRKWYESNYESFPDNLKFGTTNDLQ